MSRSGQNNLKSGGWSVMEDIQLQVLVHIFGRGRWVKIAEYMPQVGYIICFDLASLFGDGFDLRTIFCRHVA